jgi:hypothetical protein
MPPKVNLAFLVDGLGLLSSVAEAVPLLGTSVKAAVDAVKQIVQYTEVRYYHHHTLRYSLTDRSR